MFLRLETERVDIDTSSRDIGVMLVRLNKIEVATITLRETVVTVKLNLTSENRVHTTVKERGASGINKSVPTGDTKRLVVASPG
jgi:hypothetical protein